MRRPRARLRLIFILLTLAGTSVPASVVFGQETPGEPQGTLELRLLEGPEARRDDPRAKIYIVDHLAPGTTISRKIGVTNRSQQSLRVALYSAAAELGDGGFHPLEGRARNELSTWTSVKPASVDVGPFDALDATVTIAIPEDASPGERYAVVWAELPRPEGAGVGEVHRVGIRIYLSVGEGGEPASDFEIDTLTASRAKDNSALVTAQVRNTGGRALDLSGELQLEGGPSGLKAGPFPARLGTTLGVGEEGIVYVPLDKQLPNGPWDMKLMLRSGLLERTAEGRLTFPSPGGAASSVDTDSGPGNRLFMIIGLLILIALAILLIFFLLRRRRDDEEEEGAAVPSTRA